MANTLNQEYKLAERIVKLLKKCYNVSSINDDLLACIKINNEELYHFIIYANITYINANGENVLDINNWLNYWAFYGTNASLNYRLAELLIRIKYQDSLLPLKFDDYCNLAKHFFSLLLTHINEIAEIIRDESFLNFISNYDNFVNLVYDMIRVFIEAIGITLIGTTSEALSLDINDYIDIIRASYETLVSLNKS